MKRLLAGPLLAAAALAGCASIRPAQMALPPALETGTERLTISGLGGAARGDFRVAADSGRFTRSATRLALFDGLYEGESAVASFSFVPPAATAGRCSMHRGTANAGVLTYEFKPMAYICDFTGAESPARLTLAESRSTSRVQSMRRERHGQVTLGEVQLQLRSSHALAGSPVPTAAPIGYLFERGGAAVAAVEINGTETAIVLRADLAGNERQAVVLASLALALLWDPRETGLVGD
jgi:hypothetical protein